MASNITGPYSAPSVNRKQSDFEKIACKFKRIWNVYTADRSECQNINMKQMINVAHNTRTDVSLIRIIYKN